MQPILLCSDLDRTLLPNGKEEESPMARPLLREIAKEDWLKLAYVSGRSQNLMTEAVQTYALPWPDFAITDVGTMIFEPKHNRVWHKWHDALRSDWPFGSMEDARAFGEVLARHFPLRPQEEEKQSLYKLSFYTRPQRDESMLAQLAAFLQEKDILANLIFSVDTQTQEGLLDILPRKANKLFAIRFLMESIGFTKANTVFAGDSGNDLEVLASDIPSVLVANATPDVKAEAIALAKRHGTLATLYIAKGGFFGMNGHYAAGVLEGLCHFHPEVRDCIARLLA
jgi:sucrose-6F-phosphate phosphohydrolase